jgi:hypothetical protein
MARFNKITLENYEDEDVFDVVVKLEKSFGIKFSQTAFIDVKTFGDICDVFQTHINHEHLDSCTKQQAFYKIREAICKTQLIDKKQINLESALVDLFPRDSRRQKIKELENHLGAELIVLTYPNWLFLILIIGLLLSLVAFFFDWRIAVSGIIFFVVGSKIAKRLGKDLELKTARQLTEKFFMQHYINARRIRGTVNRNEILDIIKDTFSLDLGIDRVYLTRQAKLSWT